MKKVLKYVFIAFLSLMTLDYFFGWGIKPTIGQWLAERWSEFKAATGFTSDILPTTIPTTWVLIGLGVMALFLIVNIGIICILKLKNSFKYPPVQFSTWNALSAMYWHKFWLVILLLAVTAVTTYHFTSTSDHLTKIKLEYYEALVKEFNLSVPENWNEATIKQCPPKEMFRITYQDHRLVQIPKLDQKFLALIKGNAEAEAKLRENATSAPFTATSVNLAEIKLPDPVQPATIAEPPSATIEKLVETHEPAKPAAVAPVTKPKQKVSVPKPPKKVVKRTAPGSNRPIYGSTYQPGSVQYGEYQGPQNNAAQEHIYVAPAPARQEPIKVEPAPNRQGNDYIVVQPAP
jgi:hypothetical protein